MTDRILAHLPSNCKTVCAQVWTLPLLQKKLARACVFHVAFYTESTESTIAIQNSASVADAIFCMSIVPKKHNSRNTRQQHPINAWHHNRERNQWGDYGVTRRHVYAIRIDRKCYFKASLKRELWVACQCCNQSQEGRQSTKTVAVAARHRGFAIDSCHCMEWLAWIFKFYDNRRGIWNCTYKKKFKLFSTIAQFFNFSQSQSTTAVNNSSLQCFQTTINRM